MGRGGRLALLVLVYAATVAALCVSPRIAPVYCCSRVGLPVSMGGSIPDEPPPAAVPEPAGLNVEAAMAEAEALEAAAAAAEARLAAAQARAASTKGPRTNAR